MPILTADQVQQALRKAGGARVDSEVTASFKVGDRVLARNINPSGHTRVPRYIRGRQGEVECDYGVFVFPDSHAATGDQCPQHVYSVRFEARELWGPDASPHDVVYVDLWDDYLVPAP